MTTRIGAGAPDGKPALVMGGSGLTWTFGAVVPVVAGAGPVTVPDALFLVGQLDTAGRGLAGFDAQQQRVPAPLGEADAGRGQGCPRHAQVPDPVRRGEDPRGAVLDQEPAN